MSYIFNPSYTRTDPWRGEVVFPLTSQDCVLNSLQQQWEDALTREVMQEIWPVLCYVKFADSLPLSQTSPAAVYLVA